MKFFFQEGIAFIIRKPLLGGSLLTVELFLKVSLLLGTDCQVQQSIERETSQSEEAAKVVD